MDHESLASSSVGESTLSKRSGGTNGLSRAWCCTVFTERKVFAPAKIPRELESRIVFACGQLEKTEDRLRFNLYVELDSQMRVGAIREWICAKPEEDTEEEGEWCTLFEARPAVLRDRDMHIRDCTSEKNRYLDPDGVDLIGMPAFKFGTVKREGQGSRNDFEAIKEILRENGPQEGIRLVAEQFPGQFVRYPSGITQLADLVIPKVPEEEGFELRPWQSALVSILRRPAHSRHIYWVEDAKGAAGKSRLSTYLCRTMNAVELDGRKEDAAFSYTNQPIVLFDLARAVDITQLKDLYIVGEKLKNGSLFSSKYQSKLKVFKVPHVVYFSNSPPPIGMWSADRLQHIVLSLPDQFHAQSQALGAEPPPLEGADLFKELLDKESKKRKREEEGGDEE